MALFAGCVQELFFSPVNRAAARVLAALGYPVRILVGGGCCGAVHAHLGMPEVAARLARRNIEAFERSGARWLVVAAGGCYAFLREYPLHVACGVGRRAGSGDTEQLWLRRAERFRERVQEFSEFVEQQQLPALQPPAAEPITVSYQDSCHLRHVARLEQAPRRLLARIPGVRLKELPGADTCCGAGGAYWLTEPGMSLALMREKMEQVARVGPDVLVVSNPPCQLQLVRAARQGAGAWRVMHIAELLARALPGVEPERGE